MTARAYRCGGDTAAANSATGSGAFPATSTARTTSYAVIAPRQVPKKA